MTAPAPPPNALVAARDNYVAVRQEISDKATSELSKLLSPEKAARFVATGLRTLAKNPDLLAATQKSLISAFYDAAVLDLEPVLGMVYFVKYGNDATMLIGYRGLVELAKRGDPTIEDIYGQVVYEGDEFDYQEGDDPRLIHRPSLARTVADPLKITHVYAIAFRTGGRRPIFVVMTRAEVDAIRARSRSRNGPWSSDYVPMAMKTPVRALCSRRLSLSVTIKEALERDADREYGLVPIPAPTPRTSSLRESIKAQAEEIEGTVVEASPLREFTPEESIKVGRELGLVPPESATETTEPEPQPTKCGALSDPALGEIEECSLVPDHLDVKGSQRRHRAPSGSVWPA
jgi:phage RecT family recombinase